MKISTRRKASATAMALAGIFVLSSCGISTSTQPDQTALLFNDGPIRSRTFDRCIPVGTRVGHGPFDVSFAYPANQRIFDFNGTEGSDAWPYSDPNPERSRPPIITKDGVKLEGAPGALQFRLDTNCPTLLKFHNEIGLRYKAYFDGDESEGWSENVLTKYIDAPLGIALSRTASKYTSNELVRDPVKRVQWQEEALNLFPQIAKEAAGGTLYFTDFVLQLGQPALPGGLQQTINDEVTSVQRSNAERNKGIAAAESATAQAAAKVAQANAEVAVAEAEARKRMAEIAGYGGPDRYLEKLMVDKGLNPRQPTYVVPQAG